LTRKSSFGTLFVRSNQLKLARDLLDNFDAPVALQQKKAHEPINYTSHIKIIRMLFCDIFLQCKDDEWKEANPQADEGDREEQFGDEHCYGPLKTQFDAVPCNIEEDCRKFKQPKWRSKPVR